jgi:hypothetical protein
VSGSAGEDRDAPPAQPVPEVPDARKTAPPTEFDLASLPPIDSIGAGTDIRAFLQSGVPAELAKAALRRAWTADPAIRDFIGLAENQWDFTDPSAIPGFGPLQATENARAIGAQVTERMAVPTSEHVATIPPKRDNEPAPFAAETEPQAHGERTPKDHAGANGEREGSQEARAPAAPQHSHDRPPVRRAHGRVLPK